MSGYQESLVKISCLAEAAGIRKAFDEQKVPFFRMHGVERAIRDVSPDLPSRDGDMLCLPRIPIRVGDLFVVLCGDRHPYQFCSGRWFYIDGLADAVHENYRSYLVPVDEGSVRSSWGDNARLAQRSYVNWKDYLVNVETTWDRDEVDPRARFAEVVYGIGATPPANMGIDPDPIYAIARMLRERGITGAIVNGKVPMEDIM
jgi:hypothetical protein